MSDVIVVETGESEVEEAAEDVAEAVEDVTDAVEDAVMDSTTIQLVERVTRIEDGLALVASAVEALNERLAGMVMTDEFQQTEIEQTQEAVAQTAAATADAVTEVAEDIEQATDESSPGGNDVTPDEVPTVREHGFFRKWGGRR